MITVSNLDFTYRGTTEPAIRGIDFSIQEGEIFGFLGPSGAGKSTTQKILIGLLRGYQGRVSVMNKSLTDWGFDYYEHIGVSFELPNHYLKLTGIENLTYFGSLYSGEPVDAQKFLALVGLEEDGEMLVSQYSKGMKNRLNVARALLHSPDLLFMDEPTTGLDPVNARRIKDLIKEQKQAGKTVFLTTHDMTVADELCDRVAFIVDGETKLIDSPRQLKIEYGEPNLHVEYINNGDHQCADFPLVGLANNLAFTDILRANQIQTIHSLEATLESIFIQVTGRSLT